LVLILLNYDPSVQTMAGSVVLFVAVVAQSEYKVRVVRVLASLPAVFVNKS